MPGMLFLEDVLAGDFAVAKARQLVAARLLPATAARRVSSSRRADPDALATVIFSSGSTGVPKGVMLTHRNVLSNIDARQRAVSSSADDDVVLGVLPFFHSFGFTVTLWLPLLVGFGAAYHPNPTDAKTIGELAAKYGATLLVSTPTFCARLHPQDASPSSSRTLRLAIVGAEQLREPIASAFKEKFGVDLLEGYGCTEMAPVVAVNVPDARRPTRARAPARSAGRCRASSAKVVDPDTGEGPLVGKEGLLLVERARTGCAAISASPESTRAALRDGWYVTGDIAAIDEDGFIRITDRLSRFSKIAGEMVPHMKIEERLQALLAEPHACVVTSVPGRGRRASGWSRFYTDPDVPAQQIWEQLSRSGSAEAVDPEARGPAHRRRDPDARHRERSICAACGRWLPSDRRSDSASATVTRPTCGALSPIRRVRRLASDCARTEEIGGRARAWP